MTQKFLKMSKAFTLLELMVVIVIIGVLASITTIGLGTIRSKTRDSKRLADAKQIATALDLYYNDHNRYPESINFGGSLVSQDGTVTYLSKIPSNPSPRADGACVEDVDYNYIAGPSYYALNFCLSNATAGYSAGYNSMVNSVRFAGFQVSLYDAPVINLNYRLEPSGQSGVTGDGGIFNCLSGQVVNFYVGNTIVGDIACDNVNLDRIIFLPELFGLSRSSTGNANVVAAAQYLLHLDEDSDLTTIKISEEKKNEVVEALAVETQLSSSNLVAALGGETPVYNSTEAEDHLEATYAVIGNGIISSQCSPNCDCAEETEVGSTCDDGCGGVCEGGLEVDPEMEIGCPASICGDCRSTSCGSTCNTTITKDGVAGVSESYGTVQVGSQCWMTKNITNVGTKVNGAAAYNNNSLIERVCYNNDVNKCNTYGAMYAWNEAMNLPVTNNTNLYNSYYLSGASARWQGVCPKGWHLPSDYDWGVLERSLDTGVSSPVGSGTCNSSGHSFYAGLVCNNTSLSYGLRGTVNWSTGVGVLLRNSPMNIGAGGVFNGSSFGGEGVYFQAWSSTQADASQAWRRTATVADPGAHRTIIAKNITMYVRCVKN